MVTGLEASPITETSHEANSAELPLLLDGRGAVDYTTLVQRLQQPPRTIRRHLRELVDAGVLHRVGRGIYSQRPCEPHLNPEAQTLWAQLRSSDADAHLTGFDLLAGFAHQFVYDYPHLVYCHSPHLSGLADQLSTAGWTVLPAGPPARFASEPEHVVLLRGQAHAEGRYPVQDHLARPEKAWVDLLRETRRSQLGFDFGELGRILAGMEHAGARQSTLTAYARRAGYLDWLLAARGERPAQGDEQRQLVAGYAT
jgi:hypothetical protein